MNDTNQIPDYIKEAAESGGRNYANDQFPAGGVTNIAKAANHFENGFIAGYQEAARYHQSPVDGLKTAKEILQSDDDFLESISEIEEALIIERMELYADQFRQSPVAERDERLVWVKAKGNYPKNTGSFPGRIERTDGNEPGCKYQYLNLWFTGDKEQWDKNYPYGEWLSETPSHEGKDAVAFAEWLIETNFAENETWGKHDPPSATPSVLELYKLFKSKK